MIDRALLPTVLDRLRTTPAVVLLGPRQVGKTTLARAVEAEFGGPTRYLDLQRTADLRRLDDADAYLRAQDGALVIIDEIHRAPGLFPVLRGIIDDQRRSGARAGHFLLVGSTSLNSNGRPVSRWRAVSRTSNSHRSSPSSWRRTPLRRHSAPSSTSSGYAVDFPRASWPSQMRRVRRGGRTSSAAISSAMCQCSRLACRRKRSDDSGGCSPTGRAPS